MLLVLDCRRDWELLCNSKVAFGVRGASQTARKIARFSEDLWQFLQENFRENQTNWRNV